MLAHASGPLTWTVVPAVSLMGSVLVMICIIGAFAGLAVRVRQKRLYESKRSLEQIRALNWRQFEHLMAEAFRREGYVARTTDPGPDGGVDLVLTKGGERRLVQCKQWRTRRVGVGPVRELAGVVAVSRAAGGIFVTSGTYTAETGGFAHKAGIRLIDGDSLARMLDLPTSPPPGTLDTCPRCGSDLVRRIVRRGPHSGQAFLGCSSFPGCRFTQDLGQSA